MKVLSCIIATLSGGGLGNQRRALRHALTLAKINTACLVVSNLPNRNYGVEKFISTEDLPCMVKSKEECGFIVREYSQGRVFYAPSIPECNYPKLGQPMQLPANTELTKRTRGWMRDRDLVPGRFNCLHLRQDEPEWTVNVNMAAPVLTIADSFVQDSSSLLVIHSGHSNTVLDHVVEIFLGSQLIIDREKKFGKHKHGDYKMEREWESMIEMLACSFADKLLLRSKSTFSTEIRMLHNGIYPQIQCYNAAHSGLRCA
tara:strand:+ start:632 stop:1405 length:774 start_codon:yes stop_codon:yes gene_type:complete